MEFHLVILNSLCCPTKLFLGFCLSFPCLVFATFYFKHKTNIINSWPILGELPSVIWNSHRLPEWITNVFSSLGTGSLLVQGPTFSNLKYIITCHPQNIEYILQTNFSNFPKGKDFNEVFDILGNGILNVDDELWNLQRKMGHACFSSKELRKFVASMSSRKLVEYELVPFLAHVARQGRSIDLQDICTRFTFDTSMSLLFGIDDEKYLSISLLENEFAEAIDDAHESIMYRHVMPKFCWKFLRFLRVSSERTLAKAWKTVDFHVLDYVSRKRETILQRADSEDLLSIYMKSFDDLSKNDNLLRDTMLNFFGAGKDAIGASIVWFLWLVAKTPHVEEKIVNELKLQLLKKFDTKERCVGGTSWPWVFDSNNLKELAYLNAAIYESLRLYPPVPLNSKGVAKEDVLPDGTIVQPGMQIIISFYSEGRMPWIWGDDSLEFKPERWIDNEGQFSHEHFSKFFAFNSGPRTCLGKDFSFTLMKVIVAAILFNFHIELEEGQSISLKPFVKLHMKNGLLVRIKERHELRHIRQPIVYAGELYTVIACSEIVLSFLVVYLCSCNL